MPPTRVIVVADDLIWSTRLLASVRAAGAEAVAVRTSDALVAAVSGGAHPAVGDLQAFVIVDLTARAYDGIEAIGTAAAAGATVLAVGQHDDIALRKRAIAAGASRVLAYRKLADDGPATIRAWLQAAPRVAIPEPRTEAMTR